jgi:hypothetical protein
MNLQNILGSLPKEMFGNFFKYLDPLSSQQLALVDKVCNTYSKDYIIHMKFTDDCRETLIEKFTTLFIKDVKLLVVYNTPKFFSLTFCGYHKKNNNDTFYNDLSVVFPFKVHDFFYIAPKFIIKHFPIYKQSNKTIKEFLNTNFYEDSSVVIVKN